jgi:GNAT superfamily N-acetyltransferase
MSAAAPQPEGGRLSIGHEPHDGAVVQELVAELMADIDVRYAEFGGVDGDASPGLLEQWRVTPAQVTPPAGTFAVARLDGEPAACGAVRRALHQPPHVAELKRMYTRPAARRRGVSRALLAWLEAEAAALGYTRMHLETGLRQPEAIALYESAGYARIAGFGPFEDDPLSVCYGKDLASPSRGPGGPTRTYHSQP